MGTRKSESESERERERARERESAGCQVGSDGDRRETESKVRTEIDRK